MGIAIPIVRGLTAGSNGVVGVLDLAVKPRDRGITLREIGTTA